MPSFSVLTAELAVTHAFTSAKVNAEAEGWSLGVADEAIGTKSVLQMKKLAMATGLTSKAFMPVLVGQEHFAAPILHSKSFAERADTLQMAQNVAGRI